MKPQAPSLLIAIALLGMGLISPAAATVGQTKASQAKSCFMQLDLSSGQRIRLIALRTRFDLTDQQRLNAAINVLNQDQKQQYYQCAQPTS